MHRICSSVDPPSTATNEYLHSILTCSPSFGIFPTNIVDFLAASLIRTLLPQSRHHAGQRMNLPNFVQSYFKRIGRRIEVRGAPSGCVLNCQPVCSWFYISCPRNRCFSVGFWGFLDSQTRKIVYQSSRLQGAHLYCSS